MSRGMIPVHFAPVVEQVKKVMMWKNQGSTVLSEATGSGGRGAFEAVVAALEKTLEHEEVMVYGLTSVFPPFVFVPVA